MRQLIKVFTILLIVCAPFTVSLKNKKNSGSSDENLFVTGSVGFEFKHLLAGAKDCCCDLDCGTGSCIGAGTVYVCNAGGSLCDSTGTCWP